MSTIKADIYSTDNNKTWTDIELYFYPENHDYDLPTITRRLQQLMEALTVAHTYRPFLGQPVNDNETIDLPIEPIDSELGSTFAALLAFSAARGKDEHPATLIKALVYGLVRYHHTAYLQDKTAPAGDFTTPMHEILDRAEDYNMRIYDQDDVDDGDEDLADHSADDDYLFDDSDRVELVEDVDDGRGNDEAATSVECPQCHQIATDSDASTVADHGFCHDCLVAWRESNTVEPVECPQCEKVFTDPANSDAIGDHALCTTCLSAWRVTAHMLNYEQSGGDGYSEYPPFLPIPEWWAARGLATPDINADLAYDKAFKEMEME